VAKFVKGDVVVILFHKSIIRDARALFANAFPSKHLHAYYI